MINTNPVKKAEALLYMSCRASEILVSQLLFYPLAALGHPAQASLFPTGAL